MSFQDAHSQPAALPPLVADPLIPLVNILQNSANAERAPAQDKFRSKFIKVKNMFICVTAQADFRCKHALVHNRMVSLFKSFASVQRAVLCRN